MRKFMLITCGSVKVLNMSWYKSGHGTGQPLRGQLIYFFTVPQYPNYPRP